MGTERCYIPELGINCDFQTACSFLVDFTWKYNSAIDQKINNLIQSLNLPNEYIGIHIRRGDKKIEFNSFGIDEYLKKAELITNVRNAFILTDDYNVINELQSRFRNWQIYTLCEKYEKGYLHTEFLTKEIEFKHKQLIKLFASMDVLYKSNLFVGTFSSNPGMYLGMRRPKNSSVGIDFPSWRVW
jgi:hypothetical protein